MAAPVSNFARPAFGNATIEELMEMERRAAEAASQPVTGQALEAGREFSYGLQLYPIVYAGESIIFRDEVKGLTHFGPIFSHKRTDVNPVAPKMEKAAGNETRLYFPQVGEYYLQFNSLYPLKVLVLNPQGSVTENVMRLFDFVVANLVTMEGDDAAYLDDRYEAIRRLFFQSKSPVFLTQEQSLDLFMALVRQHFILPVRKVEWFSPYLKEGKLEYVHHASAEVYLPDQGKWVLFDPAQGFLVKWMDALEISSVLRKAASSKSSFTDTRFPSMDFAELKLPYHFRVVPYVASVKKLNQRQSSTPLLTRYRVRDYWDNEMVQAMLAGPGYPSGSFIDQESGLPDTYQLYQSTLLDPFLLEAQRRWLMSLSIRVQQMSPSGLRSTLDKAYAEQIGQREWETVIPKSSLQQAPPAAMGR